MKLEDAISGTKEIMIKNGANPDTLLVPKNNPFITSGTFMGFEVIINSTLKENEFFLMDRHKIPPNPNNYLLKVVIKEEE